MHPHQLPELRNTCMHHIPHSIQTLHPPSDDLSFKFHICDDERARVVMDIHLNWRSYFLALSVCSQDAGTVASMAQQDRDTAPPWQAAAGRPLALGLVVCGSLVALSVFSSSVFNTYIMIVYISVEVDVVSLERE